MVDEAKVIQGFCLSIAHRSPNSKGFLRVLKSYMKTSEIRLHVWQSREDESGVVSQKEKPESSDLYDMTVGKKEMI